MISDLNGLTFRWKGKYYKGAMRDYRDERAAAARLRDKGTEHRRTKRHRIGQAERGDYYCDDCRPTPAADDARAKRKRERKRK